MLRPRLCRTAARRCSSLSPAESMIRVFITSIGVVITAATLPANPAAMAVIPARSINRSFVLDVAFWPFRSRLRWIMFVRRYSNMGNCRPVKGKLRATSAVYPLQSRKGLLRNLDRTWSVVLWLQRFEPRAATICAFCFNTSAGVRMKQETSSAEEDAIE